MLSFEEAGAILKLKHPLLKNVLWGVPGKDRGFAYDYAVLREEHARLRQAPETAPAPAGEGALDGGLPRLVAGPWQEGLGGLGEPSD